MNPRMFSAALSAAAVVALVGCSTNDPLNSNQTDSNSTGAIVVGSQDYYSNEIIAETYAQALEAAGFAVERQLRIGQREAYLPEIEAGDIDLFPEYTGPALQHWQPDTTARLADAVYTELQAAVPKNLRVLDQSPAIDQDAYVVTREFAERWDLTTIADLAKITEPLTLGGNSEGESRPNGPRGLRAKYGVEVAFTPIEDGGGPLTVKALKDNAVQLAIIYTADPSIQKNDLVVLEDPEGLFLASNVVPLASDDVDEKAAALINEISVVMTAKELVALNARSVEEKLPAATIAKDWLTTKSLL
ncbi:ABC transporter substrate-binding protein [Arthrobacter nitrophenolicus]|uniref:ABC transporter substrate-binding protein n=1 Tax=Arthrobacter nitrophenolicus TaxID=683150 RepID=A0A4R5XPF1_9MICC|nr:ABC transporter substrate-binding protein [Arthrobacter nitrophenolicus]TDL33390.1 ABC transporter substrate-binding protein [Arthrobacter nitrophenolicus]